MKTQKILVPVDFSDNSVNAMRFAIALSTPGITSIKLIHTEEPENSRMHELRGNLSPGHLLDLYSKEIAAKNIDVTSEIIYDRPAAAILETADMETIDLIVMGTKGAGNNIRKLIGTNASEVITNATCPVLVIPESMKFHRFRKIVIGIDPLQDNEKSIHSLCSFLANPDTQITLICIGKQHEADEAAAYMKKISDGVLETSSGVKIDSEFIVSGDTHDALKNFALDIEADLLVLITHHRGVFEKIFDPGLTRKFTLEAGIALLAVPYKKVPVFFL
jgi:nucleotide-binding universal stress UspA family protein